MQPDHTEIRIPAPPILSYPTTAPVWRWQDHLEQLIIIGLLASIGSPLFILGLLGCYIHLRPNRDFGGDLWFSIAFVVAGTVILLAAAVFSFTLLRSKWLAPHDNPRH